MTALAIAGDDAAYGELVRRRQTQIRALFRRLCRDAALADDLAQQTFLQGWRRLATLRAPAAFGGWLRSIAISMWLQHVRAHASLRETAGPTAGRAAGRETALESLRPLHAALHEPLNEPLHEPTVGEQLDLDHALGQLPAPARLCIVLAYSEGMSHGEISAATGIPLGTVKSHIARGAARLRDLLRAYA